MKHTQITGAKTRKHWQSLLFILLVSCSLLQAQDYLVCPDNTYKILQLATNSQSNGTRIVLGDRNTGTTALDGQTIWVYDEPTKTIRLAANQNKCIHRMGQQMGGDGLHLYDYIPGGHPNQEWVFEGGRIKLAANKGYGIGLANQNFDAGNPAQMQEVTVLGTYQKWPREKKPQVILATDGQWRRIESPGDTYMNVAIPDPCPYPYLTIRARGGRWRLSQCT